ncbi:MAG TPA: ABC transporter permease [Bryobacteraceae bacterium]|nr:ABC transporter permease [Bryobacteraceae bacterium]
MSWWNRLLRRARMEEQLEKELRFHIEQHAADLIARGYKPAEAQRLAKIALGGPEQVKENCRDARGTRWAEDLWQDIRYALRILRQRPGFAAVGLLTLALGIGATTVMFTVLNGVLLKPLPFPEPGRLVALHAQTETWNVALYGQQNLAYLDFLDCRRESRSIDLAGGIYNGGTLSEPGEPEYVDEFETSSNLFSVLGVKLAQGRSFLPEEERAGATPVAILGYSLWRRRFAGSPTVGGMAINLDGKRYTVIGVAPATLRIHGGELDIYTPIGQDTAAYLQNRGPHPVTAIARLRPGVTLGQAQTELAMLGHRLAEQYPDTNKGRGFDVQPLRPSVGNVRSTLWLLLGAVTLVLLIACVNMASLLLARAVSRERELAMRVALGAGRGRLIRQGLTESAVLALSGGALGVLLAAFSIRPFIVFWPGGLPRAEEVQLDWRVLVFAVAVSLLTGFLFGLLPALRTPSRKLEQTLRAGSRTLAGSSRRLHSGFVTCEIALAVVLLVAAGMLGRTLLRLSSLNPGLNIHNVLITRMALSPATLPYPAKIRAAWQDVLDRAGGVPGVRSVAMVDTVPMRQGNNQLGYWTTPAIPPENRQPIALTTSVTPDYLKVMGIPLLQGRFFDDHDRLGNELVVVIDEVLARQSFPGQESIGKRIWVPDMGADPLRIVGIVGHVRHWGLAGDDQAQVRAQLYYPFGQVPDRLLRRWSELMSLAVRTNIAPLSVVSPLRRAVRGATNDQVLYEVQTMEQLASDSLARQRFLLLLFGIFAGAALLLACIGIYGVLAYLISQRIPEIGIRMALGATAHSVVRLVLQQSLGMISLGVVIGSLAALAAGHILERLVEGMQPAHVLTFAIMIPILVLAALLASIVPARRASRVDPATALRQE